MSAPSLKELLAGAQLPALPQSAICLLELSQDPDNGPPEFAVPIEADAGLASQILKFVNSSYFGFSREISNIRQAITLVGVRTIKNYALWSAVFSLMPNPKCGPFDLKCLWQDSLRRGLFARRLGKALGLRDAEDLFASALLQDMAVPLLAKELPAEYRELIERRGSEQVRLSELERERFGWTHGEAAGFVCRAWSLPEQFAELIETHTELEQLEAAAKPNPAKVAVAISSLLPASNDSQWWERPAFERAMAKFAPNQSIAELAAAVDEDFAQFAPLLKISAPTRTLADYLACEAVAS